MSTDLQEFGTKLLGDFRKAVGSAWDSWTPDERTVVSECAADYAAITARALLGQDVKRDRAHLDAQLANIKIAGQGTASDVLNRVLGLALDVAQKVLLGSII